MPTAARLRADLAEINRLAGIDLTEAWSLVNSLNTARDVLDITVPALSEFYGLAAGTAAADWYDESRAEASASGRYRAAVADLPAPGRFASLTNWAVEPLTLDTPDNPSALARALGGMQRTITDVSRNTVMGSSIADPQAVGWRRLAAAKACGFCRMLSDRGAIYSESSVDFGSHDHCSCVAVPAFGGDARIARPFERSTRNISDAERSRTQEWMAQHGY